MNNFINFQCDQPSHTFARSGEGEINAYHSDDTLCEGAEFNLADLLNDELPQMRTCPWCDKNTLDGEHIRACSGYRKSATAEEVRDAYSDPTEHTKRDSLLAGIE